MDDLVREFDLNSLFRGVSNFYVSPRKLREMIQFDAYLSNLLKPPTTRMPQDVSKRLVSGL